MPHARQISATLLPWLLSTSASRNWLIISSGLKTFFAILLPLSLMRSGCVSQLPLMYWIGSKGAGQDICCDGEKVEIRQPEKGPNTPQSIHFHLLRCLVLKRSKELSKPTNRKRIELRLNLYESSVGRCLHIQMFVSRTNADALQLGHLVFKIGWLE